MTSRRLNLTTFVAARSARFLVLPLLLGAAISAVAQQPELVLEFAPAQTTVSFTLNDVLHTVHGAFDLKRGVVHYNPASGAVSGEIVIDATSGHSGNSGRDGKMHREILESRQYPEIVFRPDRVEGKVGAAGSSNIQVHGMFALHGAEHELTIPIQVDMAPDHWRANGHFSVPYVQWGLKNPSTFLLRVSQNVEIEVQASGRSQIQDAAGLAK